MELVLKAFMDDPTPNFSVYYHAYFNGKELTYLLLTCNLQHSIYCRLRHAGVGRGGARGLKRPSHFSARV